MYFVKFYFVNSVFCQLCFCQLLFCQLLFCQLCFVNSVLSTLILSNHDDPIHVMLHHWKDISVFFKILLKMWPLPYNTSHFYFMLHIEYREFWWYCCRVEKLNKCTRKTTRAEIRAFQGFSYGPTFKMTMVWSGWQVMQPLVNNGLFHHHQCTVPPTVQFFSGTAHNHFFSINHHHWNLTRALRIC